MGAGPLILTMPSFGRFFAFHSKNRWMARRSSCSVNHSPVAVMHIAHLSSDTDRGSGHRPAWLVGRWGRPRLPLVLAIGVPADKVPLRCVLGVQTWYRNGGVERLKTGQKVGQN